ncbi:MAG TPA: VWA domain-containing protein [Egibacteraceae bacterium]|nr:VWA domain-containing protein [Egibacteraceae bacterium]
MDAVATVVGLARTLRAAGVPASPDRVHECVQALAALDPRRREDVYWAGRLSFCADREDLVRYDRVFDAYFAGVTVGERRRPAPARRVMLPAAGDSEPSSGEKGEDVAVTAASASAAEVLRSRDVGRLTPDEREELARLLTALRMPGETRRSRRFRPAHRGGIDRTRTVRELLRRGGEPARLRRQAHRVRRRKVVLLVDVSGSMAPYADALLRFAHAAARRGTAPTEVFTVGTRLTRVTREMSHRDPDTALAAVAAAVPDWSGGTRLGELLKEFLDVWGQRGAARGAVVVVLSDGWERGDVTLLGHQMERLARHAHRVVWANPRKGRPGYEPLAAGMVAALPHVDDFEEGHSLAALERLASLVARGSQRNVRS